MPTNNSNYPRYHVYELLVTEPRSGLVVSTLYESQSSLDLATEAHLRIRRNRGHIIQEEGINKYWLQSPAGVVEIVQQKVLPVYTREPHII